MSGVNWTPELALATCRAMAAHGLAPFIFRIMPQYHMGWVHQEICDKLDRFLLDVQEGRSPRLMITMPPRHGKSELASRMFPAYALGRNPDLSIIATSYSADLASRMNRDVQRIIESEEYGAIFPGTSLYGKNIRTVASGAYMRNSDIFEIVGRKGVYRSAGVGGGITGMGGNIILIDDPFKDRASADSPTIRQNIWDWYTSTLYTRLAPGGGIIIINTRWHMDDLSGRLLAAEAAGDGDKWQVINFPAIAEQDEPHRRAGEALDPARYSLEQLQKIKSAIGSRDWEALYQQHPTPDGGSVFREEWFHRWKPTDIPNRFEVVAMSWDMAFKSSDSSDYVVGQVWGKHGAQFFLLDQVRGRWSFTETVEQFVKLSEKWPHASRKYIEDKANGPAVIDTLKRKISGIIPVEPDGSKTARAYAVTPLLEAGNVLLPPSGMYSWTDDLISELLQFPAGAHDDQVDALTQALRMLTVKPGLHISTALRKNLWLASRRF